MAFIKAMAYCLPNGRLTNEELFQRFGEKAVRSITRMSGINERRIASNGETAADLATRAAQQLLADHHCDPQSIDLLLFTSQTPDYQIPATACILHERLGLRQNCACFDINQGCAAFPYSLSVANGLLETGAAERALVLNADAVSKVLYPKDRALVTLHGDAAVATLLDRTPGGGRLHGFHFGTDGSGSKHIVMPVSGARAKRTADTGKEIVTESGSVTTAEHLQMNGPAVFHFTSTVVPNAIQFALAKWKWTIEECSLVLLHQANKMMLELIYRELNVPPENRFYFMQDIGNAAGASSPMLLAEALRQGKVKSGDKLVLSGFGNGLSWSVVGIEWS